MRSLHRCPDGTYIRQFRKHIFGTAPPPQPDIAIPPAAAPPQLPVAKPQKKSMQQSFLSGAAMAQQAGGAGGQTKTGGKSLLGQ